MKRLLKLLCVVLMLGLGTATPVVIATGADAQQSMQGPDYEAWEALATRVEDALESGDVSTPILEDLRRLLVDGRQDFIDAQGTNSATIKTVRDQLAALEQRVRELADWLDATDHAAVSNRLRALLNEDGDG